MTDPVLWLMVSVCELFIVWTSQRMNLPILVIVDMSSLMMDIESVGTADLVSSERRSATPLNIGINFPILTGKTTIIYSR